MNYAKLIAFAVVFLVGLSLRGCYDIAAVRDTDSSVIAYRLNRLTGGVSFCFVSSAGPRCLPAREMPLAPAQEKQP